MPKFIYKLLDSSCIMQKGTITASSLREAALKLKPSYILSIKKSVPILKLIKHPKDFWQTFFYNLSNLLNNGFNLNEAINCMAKETKDEGSLKIILEINISILKGKDLSDCLGQYADIPYYFYIISLIKQSEKGGYLKETLSEINDFLKSKQKIRSELINTLMHPFILLIASMIFLVIVTYYIFPKFEFIFKQFDYTLPPVSSIFIILNKFILSGLILILFLPLFIYIYPKYNYLLQNLVLHIPFAKKALNKFYLASFFKNISYLLNHGFPLTEALTVSYTSTQSKHFKSKIKQINKAVQNGESLSEAILCIDFLSNFDIQTIAISEQSASLPQNLKYLANTLENDLKNDLSYYVKLVEPLIIIIIGLWLCITICVLFLPLFSCIQKFSFSGL